MAELIKIFGEDYPLVGIVLFRLSRFRIRDCLRCKSNYFYREEKSGEPCKLCHGLGAFAVKRRVINDGRNNFPRHFQKMYVHPFKYNDLDIFDRIDLIIERNKVTEAEYLIKNLSFTLTT